MKIKITIPAKTVSAIKSFFVGINYEILVLFLTSVLAVIATFYSYTHHLIIAYGDAESHLNIAKRVISGLTPGLAQLGGIWLPLPHIMMVPFVYSDFLWRSGLAGSIVSGISFLVSTYFIFKLTQLITKNDLAGFLASLVFMTNLNILYMQSTPMTELPLIMFLLLSTYYFVLYLRKNSFYPLIIAAFWGFCASISRYDGWFLVATEGLIILLHRFPWKNFFENIKKRGLTFFTFLTEKGEGELIIFATLALIGILGWFLWGYLILGNAFYFSTSAYSSKAQQIAFLKRGELPDYHNLPLSFIYYFADTLANAGIVVFFIGLVALFIFLLDKKLKNRFFIAFLFLSPFIFNVLTLFMGQSIIFLPDVTPVGFEWRLFNVRYGMIMLPTIAILIGYLFAKLKNQGKVLIILLLLANIGLYVIGYTKIVSMDDGITGLSRSSHPNAEVWMQSHYDKGLVLLDDYSRTMSIIGSGVPMKNIVYIGTKPYWQNAFIDPQNTVNWIIMQKNDAVWVGLYDDPARQANLYKYFVKVYTSPNILIFKRNK